MLTILGVSAARGPGDLSHDPVFDQKVRNRDFAAGGRRALRRHPAAPANASAHPRGFLWVVAVGPGRRASLSEVETTERPSKTFWAWPRRRAALDPRTPLWGHGKHEKNSMQQSNCGWRHVRVAGGLRGVMEGTPYGHDPNYGGAAAPDCQKLPPPSPRSNKDPKNSNHNQLAGGDTWRALRDCSRSRK